MFEINEEKMMNANVEAKAKRMMSNMISQMLLEDESVSETTKLSVRALMKARDIHELIENGIVEKYCNPFNRANAETLKKVFEYLQLVEVGIKQFVETTPFVADTEEDDGVC
jgi:hypothetical protein